MEGVSQVSVAQAPIAQRQNSKSKYIAQAAVSLGVGAVSGYAAHRHGKSEIAEAAAKCDETLIRNDLLKFFKWENGVPEASKASKEFFENAVKSKMRFAKECLESTKKFYKGYALETAIVATTVTALLTYLTSLAFGGQKKS